MSTGIMTKTDELLAYFDEYGNSDESADELSTRFACDAGTVRRAKAKWKERRMSGTLVELSLDTLETELGTQMRPGLNASRVMELKGLRESGIELDPIKVVRTPDGDIVTDGFHRLCDLEGSGVGTVRALVRTGSVDDAFLEACKANAVGPMPRDDQTKARAVITLLERFGGESRSVEWLAKNAVVSYSFADKVRDRWLIEKGKGDRLDVRLSPSGQEFASKLTPAEREARRSRAGSNGSANGHANGTPPAREGSDDDMEAEDAKEAEDERKAKAKDAEEAEKAEELRRKLESCKVREKLSPDRRQVFDIEAENYFDLTGHESFNDAVRNARKILDFKTMGLGKGPFHHRLAMLTRLPHPRDWKACLDCGGTGNAGGCKQCKGYGYTLG